MAIMQNLDVPPENQLAAIMTASRDAFIGITLERVVLNWSRAAEKIYGYSVTEMVGCSIDLLLPPQKTLEFEQIWNKVLCGEAVEALETTHYVKAGNPVQVEISLTPVLDERGTVGRLLLIVRDIAVRKRTEETVLDMEDSAWHRAVLLETANRVALDILASRTGVEALRHIAEAARVLGKARFAALGVAHLDSRPGALRLREFITTGLTPEEEAVIGSRPVGHGVLGLLLERTTPLRIDRLAEHPASVGFPPGHPPMESFLGVPIRRGDVVLGKSLSDRKTRRRVVHRSRRSGGASAGRKRGGGYSSSASAGASKRAG